MGYAPPRIFPAVIVVLNALLFWYASGEGHRGGGRTHADGLAQNARSGQLVYDQGIRQLQRLAAAGANSKAGDR